MPKVGAEVLIRIQAIYVLMRLCHVGREMAEKEVGVNSVANVLNMNIRKKTNSKILTFCFYCLACEESSRTS